jgi:hypothetical protein
MRPESYVEHRLASELVRVTHRVRYFHFHSVVPALVDSHGVWLPTHKRHSGCPLRCFDWSPRTVIILEWVLWRAVAVAEPDVAAPRKVAQTCPRGPSDGSSNLMPRTRQPIRIWMTAYRLGRGAETHRGTRGNARGISR